MSSGGAVLVRARHKPCCSAAHAQMNNPPRPGSPSHCLQKSSSVHGYSLISAALFYSGPKNYLDIYATLNAKPFILSLA